MSALTLHGLLGLSVAGLGGAGFRAASAAAPHGLERALAAVALAAAAAVAEAMALGLVGLGGSPLALAAAVGATWLVARRLLPRAPLGAGAELLGWWRARRPLERLMIGALAGMLAVWTALLLRNPTVGSDTLLYHLAEAVTWVRNGHPGSVEPIVSGLPVGYYPLGHEVLISWGVGLSRGFVYVTLLIPAVSVLIGLGWWRFMRTLQVTRPVAGLGAAALVTLPPAWAYGRSGAALDPAALAWLGVCAALCAGSRKRPALLAPALVAAGLAIGAKTTALPLGVVAIALALVACRAQLRLLAGPLAAAGLLAGVVGAFWYLRNLAVHGSPFWPYLDAPWGAPAPRSIAAASISFLDRPGTTLSRLDERYLGQFAGLLVLLGAALVAPLAARRREIAGAALLTGLSLLLWINAPLTGVSDNPGFDAGTADSVRYLLPGLGAAAVTLGLASRVSGAGRALAIGALTAATTLNLFQAFRAGFPSAPSPLPLLAGAAAGAAAVAVMQTLPQLRLPSIAGATRAGAALAGLLAGLLAAPLAPGYLARHSDAGGLGDVGLVRWFDARREDERPVSMSGAAHALLAGDHLQRRVALLGDRTPCPEVEARRRRGWVVISRSLTEKRRQSPGGCSRSDRPAYSDKEFQIFAPRTEGGR